MITTSNDHTVLELSLAHLAETHFTQVVREVDQIWTKNQTNWKLMGIQQGNQMQWYILLLGGRFIICI